MFGKDGNDAAAVFANAFLERYTNVGFGALSKREVDLLVMQLLQEHLPGFRAMNDFDAAILLRTTKRKIRGLRDELSYREGTDDDALKQQLRNELQNAEVLASDHGTVRIQIDDAAVRGFAEKIVRSEFGLVDTSFNSAILQLSGEKYLLLAYSVLKEPERKKAEEEIQKLGPAPQEQVSSFEQFKAAFISGAGNQAGKMCVSGAMALISGGASVLLDGAEPIKVAGQGIGEALKKAWKHFNKKEDEEASEVAP